MRTRLLLAALAILLAAVAVPGRVNAVSAVDEPVYIFVCTNSSSCSTSTVGVLFETSYVKDVLPNEWLCSWTANSLNAGAVAVRTYGWYRHEHPRSSSFDIYASTLDQVYRQGSSGLSGTGPCNSAVADTAGVRVEYGGGRINAQYRAETGNPTQAGGTAYLQSVSDPHTTQAKTGPGLCQNGSQWYGRRGTAYGAILSHYYTGVTVATAANYYKSQRCSCSASGCSRVETWFDTGSGTTFTRVYSVAGCAS